MKTERGYYDMLVNSCARHYGRVAVRHLVQGQYRTYTYSELYGVCEYVSQNLQLLRCGSGIIGILTHHNPLIPSVIAAVHKNSPTFMFLDPSDDNGHIMSSINFQAIISLYHINQPFEVKGKPDREICIYDMVIKFFKKGSSCELTAESINEHSFIVMTSGSTGDPKQIRVPIQCIQPNINDLKKMFNMTCEDVVYFSTPLTFDPSMVELLLACASGASLLLAPADADILSSQQSKHGITVWQTTPSKFFQFSNTDIASKILNANSKLKVLALGGEPLNRIKQLKELKAKENKTRIFCLYGVTELSCWACAVELFLDKMADHREVPLGDCLSETDLEVSLHKEGGLGNIMLGSATRKCNILNKPTHHTEYRGTSWIDTGDVGEVRNGTVYFRGRTDEVIKRFGHKVDLQLIEKTVMLCPGVKSCSCLWLPNPHVLILYYTSDVLFCEVLGKYLNNRLDDKHLPDKIVRIDSMPLNRHGKICKNNLAARYSLDGPQVSLEHFKSIIMKELQWILKHKFSYKEIEDKNFFTLGGTSFQAVALCNKLAATYPEHNFSLLPFLLMPNVTIGNIINKLYVDFSSNKKIPKLELLHKRKKKKKTSSTILEDTVKKKQSDNFGNVKITKLWSFNTGKCVDATPTIFQTAENGLVAVGSHSGKLVVLNTKDGAIVGSTDLKSRIEAPVFCYRHMITGEALGAVGTYDGTIINFSLSKCTIVWKINIKSMIKSKAASANGMLYVASYDGNVRCINFMTGDIICVITIGGHGISSDLVSTRDKLLIVATLAGECACISADSNIVVWRHKVGSPIFASPVLYDNDKMVVFAEVNGIVHCHSVETGNPVWKYDGAKGNIFSSFSIKRNGFSDLDLVFGCHDSVLYCLSVQQNKIILKWKTKTAAAIYSTPCYFSNEIVLACSINGRLYAIESGSGNIISEYSLLGETFSSPTTFEDQIFVGCRDDNIYSLKLSIEKE